MNLLLHIGHGKTGSSYLQSWLTCNSSLLHKQLGIMYLLRDINGKVANSSALRGDFSMGNGFILEEVLEQCRINNSNEVLERLFYQNGLHLKETPKGIIFSSETFLPKMPNILPTLIPASQQLNMSAIKILLYVRDPLAHACSVYSQMVKRHGYFKTLDEWVDAFNFPKRLLISLQELSHYSDFISLDVFHYDRQRDSILDGLLHLINVEEGMVWNRPPKNTVNRSLTRDELNLMRLLNKQLGEKTAVLGERFVNNQPNLIPAVLIPSVETQKKFIQKWQATIDLINSYLPHESELTLQLIPQEGKLCSNHIADNIDLNTRQVAELCNFLINKS